MSHRFVRCPHCRLPHDAAERVCPTTGKAIDGAAPRSRMSELPPPERRPEPLGFDPARSRFAEREAAARAAAAAGAAAPKAARIAKAAAPTPPAAGAPPRASRSLDSDLVGRTIGERYVVKGVLGEGGMGMVYEAEHLGLGRAVAVKVLNPTQAKKRVAVKRFQQEARAAGAIGHPNICEVYDLGQLDDGSPYLVMEKLVGTTLADRIQREGGLPFDEIADVMQQVLSGLIAAHDKGIVHRDIKPENIFLAQRLGSQPIVKILDFGVSKMMPAFQGGEEQLDLTRTGMVMGTPYYMSPEQARGERNLDGRVDVYACGVMMYEAIVGKRPFLAPNYNALLLAIINTTPKRLRDVRPKTPAAMETMVTRMMAKAREDRYPTANAVLHDLQALGSASASPSPNRLPPPPTAEERRRAPVLGGRDPRDSRAAVDGAGSRGARQAAPAEGAGGTLRSRLLEPPAPPSQGGATRPDARPPNSGTAEGDQVEIPISVAHSDYAFDPSAPARTPDSDEFVEDVPTQVFRPGTHPAPRPRTAPPAPPPTASSREVSATHVSPLAIPPDRASGRAPGPPDRFDDISARRLVAPPEETSEVEDEWDGATEITRPADMALKHPLARPQHAADARRPEPRPFNPDETVKLNGDLAAYGVGPGLPRRQR